MNLNNEQLQFFKDEVLGLFDWGDEEEEMGLDPLNFVRQRIKDERKWAKMTAKKYAETEKERDEYMNMYSDVCDKLNTAKYKLSQIRGITEG